MESFFEWVRKRFILGDLMQFADVEDEILKTMMIQNGSSRDEFIKLIVFKLLLDIDSESVNSREHNLENIFVSFGILDKEVAQQFLNGNMSTNLQIATWRKIIEVLIPNTIIAPQWTNYDEMINNIHEKYNHFKLVENKNILPPELLSKLNVQLVSNENSESIEDNVCKVIEIINKPPRPNESNDNKTLDNSEEQPSIHSSLEFMDLASIKNEIDQFVKVSNENMIDLSNIKPLIQKSIPNLVELKKEENLIQSEYFESKINDMYKLIKADQDLQTLVSSLADQTETGNNE